MENEKDLWLREEDRDHTDVFGIGLCGPAFSPAHLEHCETKTIRGESFVNRPQYPAEDLEGGQDSPSTSPGPAGLGGRPLTYLACPYSHPSAEVMEWRYQQSVKATAWLISEEGLNVFSPVTHSHPLVKSGCAGDWKSWEKIDREYLGISKRVLVLLLKGWDTSTGVLAEIKIARKMGLPVEWVVAGDGRYATTTHPESHVPLDVKLEVPLEDALFYEEPPTVLYSPAERGSFCEQFKEGVEKMRTFATGATRGRDSDKPDYEGFLSPLALAEFGRYMLSHQVQADGTRRGSDNWQKGIPQDAYMKSMWRHLMQIWTLHRGFSVPEDEQGRPVTLETALSAMLFNVQGYLHEVCKAKQ